MVSDTISLAFYSFSNWQKKWAWWNNCYCVPWNTSTLMRKTRCICTWRKTCKWL